MSKRTMEAQNCTPCEEPDEPAQCGCDSDEANNGGGSLIDIDVGTGAGSGGNGSLIDLDVATGSGAGSGGGSLVDVDVASGGESGSLVAAQVAGGSILDASIGTGDEYSGIGLKVAALADQGLLDVGSDNLVTADVGTIDAGGLVGSLLNLGHIGLPDLPDIGGILDSSSC